MKMGLIGRTLGHSCSPEIHEKIFQALQMQGSSYELLETEPDKLGKRLESLQAEGYLGVNVTIPYKRDVIPFLKSVSREAEAIGAVNTIRFDEDGMHGFNTDYTGFGRALSAMGADPEGRACVVLGTGGAARAVIQYLADSGASSLLAVSRNKYDEKQCEFQTFLEGNCGKLISYDELKNEKGDILVNCTPVGMYPKVGRAAVGEEIVRRFSAVMDLIYNPKETELLRMGRVNGLKTGNGMVMLTAQAAAAEEIWLDRVIPEDVLNRIAEEMQA